MPWVLEETFAAGGLDLRAEVTLRRLDPLYRIRWAGDERHFDFADRRSGCGRRSPASPRAMPGALRRLPRRAASRSTSEGDPRRRAAAVLVGALVRGGRCPSLAAARRRRFRCTASSRATSTTRASARRSRSTRCSSAATRSACPPSTGRSSTCRCSTAAGTPTAASTPWSRRWRARSTCAAARGSSAIERARRARHAASRSRAASASPPTSSSPTPTCCARTSCSGARAPRRRLRPTMSCFLLYLGTDRRVPRAAAPHAARRLRATASSSATSRAGRRCRARFSTYVHAPARTEPAMAAPGGDSLCVLLPVPNLRAGDRLGAARRTACATRWSRDLEATFGLDGLGALGRAWSTG